MLIVPKNKVKVNIANSGVGGTCINRQRGVKNPNNIVRHLLDIKKALLCLFFIPLIFYRYEICDEYLLIFYLLYECRFEL